MFIYGEYSTWKSWFAMDAAWSISTGHNWLLFGTVVNRVLIINSEISKLEYQERWSAFTHGRGISPNGNLLIDTDIELNLDNFNSIYALEQWIAFYRIKVLILDNLYSSMKGDLNKNTDSKIFIDNIKKLCALGIAVIIVHHSHQPQYTTFGERIQLGGYTMFGSSYWSNWADTILEVKNIYTEGYNDTVQVTPQKHRLARLQPLTAVYQFSRQTTEFNLVL